MRRHATAATAGSTKRRAMGLGRFFRGVDAGRDASLCAKGTGASSWRRPIAGSMALVLVVLLTLAGMASAAEPPSYRHSFGPDGTEGTAFKSVNSVAVDQQSGNVYVLDRGTGALYKFDAAGHPVDFGGTAPFISGNRITELATDEAFNEAQVAVDSASHVVYVTEPTAIRAFQADGEAAEFTAGPGAGSSEIGGFSALHGVAVDGSGNIYAADTTGGIVKIYTSSGEELNQFAAEIPKTIAVDGNSNVYIHPTEIEPLDRYTPSEVPITATSTYSASEPIPHAGYRSGVGVDPLSGDIYASLSVSGKGSWIAQYDKGGTLIREYSAAGVALSQGVAVVAGGETFYSGTAEGSFPNVSGKVAIFAPEPPGPPTIETAGAYGVSSDGASLEATITPHKVATTYRFEYGSNDCSLPASGCTAIPVPDGSIGLGNKPVKVSQPITGLQPQSTYHLRVVAENAEGTDEAKRVFTTQAPGSLFELSDSRVWEMVSPPQKRGGSIQLKINTIVQAAASGNGIKYLSRGSFEPNPEGNRAPEFSANLALRSPTGWSSKDITSANDEAAGTANPDQYPLLSTDLSKGLLVPPTDTPLSPDATEHTPYLRTNTEPRTFTPLVNEANVTSGLPWNGGIDLQGANAELTDIALGSGTPLLSSVSGGALYHWSAGELEVVSELPADEGGGIGPSNIGSGIGSIRNAISENGSRIFWAPGEYNLNQPALYVRDTAADETTRLDTVKGGSGAGGPGPAYQAATPDGGVVYFTDSVQLTADASSSGRDLYRCELGPDTSEGCVTLTDISAPIEGSGESTKVKELVPAISEDGSRAYFVAEGVLDTAPNGNGAFATAGEPNLYLWEEGQGVRFITTLAPGATLREGDAPAWGSNLAPAGSVTKLSSYGSPNGRYFTFTSQRSLTGYENNAPGSALPNQEVFVYDAVADRLDCASCIPTGAGPVGELRPNTGGGAFGTTLVDIQALWDLRQVAAILPQAASPTGFGSAFRQPRVVFDSGRVFFNAIESLVPGDTNGEWDVYQWEPLGTGSCTAQTANAAAVRSGTGCVGLISSGRAEGESAFLDASETGNDAFFLTRGRLSVLDEDDEIDVYDARVNGTKAILIPNAECLGEACQPAAIVPNDPTPASAGFKGQGNVKPNARRRCVKSKRAVRQNGKSRCVPRKHKAKAKGAAKNGRASR